MWLFAAHWDLIDKTLVINFFNISDEEAYATYRNTAEYCPERSKGCEGQRFHPPLIIKCIIIFSMAVPSRWRRKIKTAVLSILGNKIAIEHI